MICAGEVLHPVPGPGECGLRWPWRLPLPGHQCAPGGETRGQQWECEGEGVGTPPGGQAVLRGHRSGWRGREAGGWGLQWPLPQPHLLDMGGGGPGLRGGDGGGQIQVRTRQYWYIIIYKYSLVLQSWLGEPPQAGALLHQQADSEGGGAQGHQELPCQCDQHAWHWHCSCPPHSQRWAITLYLEQLLQCLTLQHQSP